MIAKGKEDYLSWYDIKNGISLADVQEPGYNDYANEMYEQLYSNKAGAYNTHMRMCGRKKKKVMSQLRDDIVKRYIGLAYEKRAAYDIHFKAE
ncbi:MAG: hypothetical protein J6M30_04365 [Bacteroidales bacterium]|nr:hypothetical protein [Bacteroidales bacterium]